MRALFGRDYVSMGPLALLTLCASVTGWIKSVIRSIASAASSSVVQCSILVLALLLAVVGVAAADPPPGTDLSSSTHAWFERQHSAAGAWCCDVADGHLLDDKGWRMGPAGYEVRIFPDGGFIPIPSDALRDPSGGPNTTGHAIVWYRVNEYGLKVWCFAPGYRY